MALNGHPKRVGECLLLGVERTSRFQSTMSGYDPKRTFAAMKQQREVTALAGRPLEVTMDDPVVRAFTSVLR
jgi:hypothetical protein